VPGSLPTRVTLPSGVRVELAEAVIREAAPANASAAPIADAFAALSAEGALRTEEGEPIAFGELSLRDAHVLRALVLRSGIVRERARTMRCFNCGEPITFVPSEAFEPGPFVDDELADPELDAPFDFDARHAIPLLRTDEGAARTVTLAPRTVDEAGLLAQATGPLDLRPAVVAALGVRALGRARSAKAIARALSRADDDAWSAFAGLWERAHYAQRLIAEVVCACGARNDHPVPADREIDALAPLADVAAVTGDVPGFPDEATFAKWVRAAEEHVFRARGIRNVPVVVDYDVPACDEGGVPMLGCYTPMAEEGSQLVGARGPEIRLFYRSFREEKRLDPAFDVRAEVDETVDHESIHHLHFLRGEDPLDDEEHAVIAKERALVVGKKELTRRAAKGAWADAVGFLRISFPLVAVLVLLMLWQRCAV